MIAFICKYWATYGIYTLEGEALPKGRFMGKYSNGNYQSFPASEWGSSIDEAMEKANILREKKLVSLQKQVIKLTTKEIKVHA